MVHGGPGEEICFVEICVGDVRAAPEVHRDGQEDAEPRNARAEEGAEDESLDDEVIARVRAAPAGHLVPRSVPHPIQLPATRGHPHPPSPSSAVDAAGVTSEAAAVGRPTRDVREVIQAPEEPQEHQRHRQHHVELERVPQRSQD